MQHKVNINSIIHIDKNDNKYKRYDYSKVKADLLTNIRGTENNIKDSR